MGKCPKGHESCHRDGNPTNNRLRNLRWGTHQDNMRDCIRHERFFYAAGRIKGSAHVRAKLTESLVRKARCLSYKGITQRDIIKRLRLTVTQQTLSKALRGAKWAHVYGAL